MQYLGGVLLRSRAVVSPGGQIAIILSLGKLSPSIDQLSRVEPVFVAFRSCHIEARVAM